MRVSAKVDYAVRAAVELAAAESPPVKGEAIAQAQDIPLKFLENILGELSHAGLVRSQRGTEGGYWLARPPRRSHRGRDPRGRGTARERARRVGGDAEVRRDGRPLGKLWVAVRANLRAVLETVTLADIAKDDLPALVDELTSDPEVWATHCTHAVQAAGRKSWTAGQRLPPGAEATSGHGVQAPTPHR